MIWLWVILVIVAVRIGWRLVQKSRGLQEHAVTHKKAPHSLAAQTLHHLGIFHHQPAGGSSATGWRCFLPSCSR